VNRDQYARMRAVEDRHWWYVGTRAIARDVLRGLRLPRGARVLDAGCGTGGNLAMLGELGEVTGLDWSDLALELAAARGSAWLVRGSVAELPFAPASFDLATSFEVLYHRAVPDDVAALRELARVLRPGGWLLLRLPAYEWLRGAHDEQVHTARRYTIEGLRAKLETAGLRPRRLTHLNGLLLPLAAAKRVVERATGGEGDDLGEIPPLLDRAFRSALVAERSMLRRRNLPFGVSVMAVAQRGEEPDSR
jgi:SAM-dependent methyltransferase